MSFGEMRASPLKAARVTIRAVPSTAEGRGDHVIRQIGMYAFGLAGREHTIVVQAFRGAVSRIFVSFIRRSSARRTCRACRG